ncbi:hypothetical protein O181_079222 [Austropuccinia psidii MF-1]|uniref:Reverse transcriptase Ty1/copia-type domain-containing protein n=1 Tax=Austropuccinia psidii MF-1 TaxID=1389203 RepID=A0A9Q3FLN3_9BASI|nr:hypothetical protein [Austropuccinia psidii MF-1]
MDNLGEVSYALGIKITRNRALQTIALSQELYINKILKEYGIEDCKSVVTPMIQNERLTPATAKDKISRFDYGKAVGLLNYLSTCTRPDVSFVTSALSQFLEKPTAEHVLEFKRVLRYLQGTKQEVLILGGKKLDDAIVGFCDLDFGSNFDGRSFSGYGLMYGGLITWKTKKQPTVALLTTEAELKAMTELLQDVIWVKGLIFDFKLCPTIKVRCDNQGAIALCQNPLYHH